MVPHINGKLSEFLNGYYHYNKHKQIYSSKFFKNPNVLLESNHADTNQNPAGIHGEFRFQSGKIPDFFLQCTIDIIYNWRRRDP